MELSDRDNKYLEIITRLNKAHQQGSIHYYDCGELGIIHIYWHGNRWEHEWIPVEEDK